jgi:competence protein ComEC
VVWAFDHEENEAQAPRPHATRDPILPRPNAIQLQAQVWWDRFVDLVVVQNNERVVLWLPVAFAFGAGVTCSVRADDPAFVWVGATGIGLLIWMGALFALARDGSVGRGPMWLSLALIALMGCAFAGGGAAGLLRAQAVTAPVIADHKGARVVTGYVDRVDKSLNGAWRARIAVSNLSGVAIADRPSFVRISLQEDRPPLPGSGIRCSAILRPPPGPVVPGAYDHSRRAWFEALGGVGFALENCEAVDLGKPGLVMGAKLVLSKWRAQAAANIVEAAQSPGAGFLAAVATGDRAWLSQEDTEALQVSGLSHIISVSGLHVSLLGGMVFFTIWKLIALVPALALRIDARKIGALVALFATGAYTLFSGAEAPAVRAFIMSGIAFGAILLDRKAISMRGLAIAAIAVLMVLPESALDPGFQMSFLATAALVAMWEVWERRRDGETSPTLFRTIFLWIGAAAATSFVAGLATAPVSAATFHRLTPWALPANLIVAPINDFIVAPLAMLGAVLSPFGLGEVFWKGAAWGLTITLKVAHFFAGLPGAAASVSWTNTLPPVIMIVAILWITLWRGPIRYLGGAPILVALAIWTFQPKPVGWISPGGKAVLMTPKMGPPQLCRTVAGRFDAARLMDHAGLSQAQSDYLMPPSSVRLKRGCFTGEGDWEARYVPSGSRGEVLALSLDGKSFAFGRGDLPDGALVMRSGWRVYLADIPPRQGPWARQVTVAEEDLSGAAGLRIGQEQ